MKNILFLLLGFLPFAASAQTVDQSAVGTDAVYTICEQLRRQGRVTIQQDPRLEALLGKNVKTYNAASHLANRDGKKYLVTSGYRVRVFSGNNQTSSREEAYKIESELKGYLPDLETYVLFKTPNWRLVIGNYRTQEEATAALRSLKQKFPVYGREMFVVKDDIEIPIEEERK